MKLSRKVAIAMIRGYQYLVSPFFPPCCRFAPTCSHYAMNAVAAHGVLVGSCLALWRLLRCHPWGGEGYDPVPDRPFRWMRRGGARRAGRADLGGKDLIHNA